MPALQQPQGSEEGVAGAAEAGQAGEQVGVDPADRGSDAAGQGPGSPTPYEGTSDKAAPPSAGPQGSVGEQTANDGADNQRQAPPDRTPPPPADRSEEQVFCPLTCPAPAPCPEASRPIYTDQFLFQSCVFCRPVICIECVHMGVAGHPRPPADPPPPHKTALPPFPHYSPPLTNRLEP